MSATPSAAADAGATHEESLSQANSARPGGVWLGGVIVLVVIYGSRHSQQRTSNRRTSSSSTTGCNLGIFSINKAVLYLFLAAGATCASMIYIARRMQQRPNKVQAAVEALYELMRDNITGSAMSEKMAAQVVSVHRRAVSVHHVLQPRRLHPAADEHRARDQCVRPAHTVLLAVCGDRQPLDPARARARRVRLLHLRRRAREGPDRLPERACPRRRRRRDGRRDLRPGGALQLHAASSR